MVDVLGKALSLIKNDIGMQPTNNLIRALTPAQKPGNTLSFFFHLLCI